MTADEIIQRLLAVSEDITEIEPGVYTHVFTPPEMTMQDVAELLSRIPTEEEDED